MLKDLNEKIFCQHNVPDNYRKAIDLMASYQKVIVDRMRVIRE